MRVDLTVLAQNGMRRGRTTGTCAAAAAKAAVLALNGEVVDEVDISLPDSGSLLAVPIARIERTEGTSATVRAEVIKDAGDDPDVTDGATIFSLVSEPATGNGVRLGAAEGVGTVTRQGLRVAVGEPAINPVPRQMIFRSVYEALAITQSPMRSLEIGIGCVNGGELARRTFNPRLGVEGGISILGTTGIVEPMSMAAYQASVEVYIRVGLAASRQAALLPGNIGTTFARALGLEKRQIIHISNFLGFALSAAEAAINEYDGELERLWVLGHPGKLCKAFDGYWNTHSKESGMAMGALARSAAEFGLSCAASVAGSNTVEAAIQIIQEQSGAGVFWAMVEERLASLFAVRVPSVGQVLVRLFDMSGRSLSARGAV